MSPPTGSTGTPTPALGPDGRLQAYRIRLVSIRFRGKHGVSASERELFQDFVADVDVDLPISLLAKEDRYAEVFDYDRVATLVVEEGTTTSCQLLEILAQRMIAKIFAETPALAAKVCVQKNRPPTTPSVEAVSVTVEAIRDPRAGSRPKGP